MSNELKKVANDLQVVGDSQLNPLVAMAMSSDIDPDKLDKLMGLQERYESNEAQKSFNVAMTKAKKGFRVAAQSGFNRSLGNKYSLLIDLDNAVRESLSDNGLSYRFVPSVGEGDKIVIRCTISHEQGHSESGEYAHSSKANANKGVNDLQSARSVSTYIKGMLLSSMLGIMSGDEADDDAQKASDIELISEEQALELDALLAETETNIIRFLKHYKIESLTDLYANNFQGAKESIMRNYKTRSDAK